MTLSDLEWLNKIFNDTKRRSVSLWQISCLLSHRSRQRERLSASELSICLSISLSVWQCLSVAKMQKKAIFSKTKQLNSSVTVHRTEGWPANLGIPSSLTRSRRKPPVAEGTPLDVRLPHGITRNILRCNPWGVCRAPKRYFVGVLYTGKIGQNAENE